MTFALEREMSAPVRRWLHRQRLLIKDEFVLPWGICDFVALSFNQTRLQKRLEFGQFQSIGSLHRIELLRQIPDKESGAAVSLHRLQKDAACSFPSTPAIESELQSLIERHFVVRNPNGSLQKLNGWAPLHNRIVAVEVKLSRISEVLAQAASHRAFASESYVAMPAEIAERTANSSRSSEFHANGVGILAVTRTACKVVLPSSALGVEVEPTLQMHCVERFWRTRGSSS
jgi:hypothetical protein